MRTLVDWLVHGEVDWDGVSIKARQLGPFLAGVVFAAGWWVWADALIVLRVVAGLGYPFRLNWPGIVASLGLLLINLLPRGHLAELESSGEEGALLRGRLWLAASLAVAFGAIGGGVAVLLATAGSELQGVGVASVVQCGLVLAAALLLWSFRSDDEGGGGGYFAV